MNESMVSFEWTLDDEDDVDEVNALAADLEQVGGEVRVKDKPKAIIPMPEPETIQGIVALTALAQRLFDWWSSRRRKGLLIYKDSDGKVKTRHVDVPYGQVLFMTPDGEKLSYLDVSSMDRLQELVAAANRGDVPTGGTRV